MQRSARKVAFGLAVGGALLFPFALPTTESEAAQKVVRSRPGVIQFIGVGNFRTGPPDRPRIIIPPGPSATPGDTSHLSPHSRGEISPRKLPVFPPGEAAGELEESQAPAAKSADSRSTTIPFTGLSFDGINALNDRRARRGNQFSGEPPDQGLCVGNGFVLESVNTALRVRSMSGQPLTPIISQSEFYGYPPDINRRTGRFGQTSFDVSCHYDSATQRWFHLAVTIDIHPTEGVETGRNRLDLAVSRTADPRGAWNYYAVPQQNDGSEGTPDHNCAGGPCFGDYPKLGVDRHGVYLSTIEFPFFEDGFEGSSIYAISKPQILGGAKNPNVVQFEKVHRPDGVPAFVIWPATTPRGNFESEAGGTEYLLSNLECPDDVCADNRLAVWAIPNTRALARPNPSLLLISRNVRTAGYMTAPRARQKPGPFPLGECINDTRIKTPFGRGCWHYFFDEEPAHNERVPLLDPNVVTSVTQVTHSRGGLWTAQGSAVRAGSQVRSGILHSVVRPEIEPRDGGRPPLLTATRERTSRFGIPNHDLMFPAVGVGPGGKVIVSYSISGDDLYPSSAYSRLDQAGRFGPVRITGVGRGPIEGFTGYRAFEGPAARERGARFGDYHATAIDGQNVWIAGEYAGQACSLKEYVAGADDPAPGFTCEDTRSALQNWYTRIAKVPLGN